ncbi:AraC family transcriptional regulator [Paenibacillus dendritiformis]|uniref:AraC family transcriptional regulator n=1 Tax=Paenibacillus dendritiformis TaxID=130049 RepID=UPI000DA95A34|nr:ABC transporter substrate-binding protein [Paenibacillus dendritiformis]PZM63355.1 AraC family transcriptional regulator [Paenibacillus dendritiformis]
MLELITTMMDSEHICRCLEQFWFKLRGVDIARFGRMEPQLLNTHVLVLSKHGEGRVAIDYAEYRLGEGAVHVAAPGQTIGMTAEEGQEAEAYVIRFDIQSDREPEAEFPLRGEVPVHREAPTVVLCERLYDKSRPELWTERLLAQAAFHELLCAVVANIRRLPDDPRAALERTKAYIDNHFNENLTIGKLARMADISPKYYVDLFKKTYGQSTIDYITEVRIRHAKRMMLQADARLRDIAQQVGYSDEFYFSRKFKQQIGVAPTVYMKKRRRKIVAYTPGIAGHMLALGQIPYAAPLHPKWSAHYYEKYRFDIPHHLSAYRYNKDWKTNIEALRAAKPELVICDSQYLQPEEKTCLESVAEVKYISGRDHNWREQFRLTARYIGAEPEAESWLSAYGQKAASARERLQKLLSGEAFFIMCIHKDCCYPCTCRGMSEVLYDELQLNRAPYPAGDSGRQAMSLEELAHLNPDRILLNVCQEPESLQAWQAVQASRLWSDMKAVRRNHVYPISSDPWREYSAYACERMIDDLMKQLAHELGMEE